ncbi:MAG: hypothetical protein V3U87_07070 [Methylococcaceae bacterium]
MNIFSKKIIVYGSLLSVIVGAVYHLNNKKFGSGLNEGIKQTSLSKDQLTDEINRLSFGDTELKLASTSHSQNDIKNKLNKINGKIEALRDQYDSLSNMVALSPFDINDDESEDTMLSEEEEVEVFKKQVKEQIDLYDNLAAEEGVDQKWATDAQANIYESYSSLTDSGIDVADVKCHRSFCQAAIILDDGHGDDVMQKLQEIAPWEDGESFVWFEDLEQGEGSIYLSREGEKLPNIDG